MTVERRIHLVFATTVLASVAANVLAAEPTWVARGVAAWPPLALLFVVDVLGRAPVPVGWLGRVSVAGAGSVAAVAALASFSHVRHVALAVGESELVAWVLPISVDGLAVVCSVALVEINRRKRAESSTIQPSPDSSPDLTGPSEPADSTTPTPRLAFIPRSHGPTTGLNSVASAQGLGRN